MSKVKITGHASGSGTLTLTGPNTNSDRTLTLPDNTGTLLTTEGAVVINESGADVDFRVESDGETHALFVQGSEGRVGINKAAPSARLEIVSATETALHCETTVSGEYAFIAKSSSSNSTPIADFRSGSTSHLKVLADGRGLSQFTAKAWVNFNGEDTLAVRDSHNVSSVTDNATGDYTVNFTSAMADANYCTQFTGSHYNDGLVARTNVLYYDTPQTTTTVRLRSKVTWGSDSYADLDSPNSNVLVFGD